MTQFDLKESTKSAGPGDPQDDMVLACWVMFGVWAAVCCGCVEFWEREKGAHTVEEGGPRK